MISDSDSTPDTPKVISLDWVDADKETRPEPWPRLLQEGRMIVAADIVCPTEPLVEAELSRYTIQTSSLLSFPPSLSSSAKVLRHPP